MSKLTAGDLAELVREADAGVTQRVLAARYGCTQAAISLALRRARGGSGSAQARVASGSGLRLPYGGHPSPPQASSATNAAYAWNTVDLRAEQAAYDTLRWLPQPS